MEGTNGSESDGAVSYWDQVPNRHASGDDDTFVWVLIVIELAIIVALVAA